MKIVFINLHGDTNVTVAYLHSLIEKAGFDITTIHFRRLITELTPSTKAELETLKRVIKKINPEVILLSVNSISFWNAVTITNIFKNKKVIWGGVQPLIDPERCMEYVNIIVRGEGDGAAIDILNAIQNKKPLDKIKNVWLKKGNKIIKNDFRPLIQNLDELPYPDFSDKNKLYLLGSKVYKKNPLPHSNYEYNVTFSRGCPFSCTYCINHFYNKTFKNKYLRRRSVNSAINELRLAKKLYPKLKNINFWDDVFMMDTNWVREFVKKYKKYINLPFFAYGNATFVNNVNMGLLKSAGISFFELGVQSGSEKIRKNIFGRIDSDKQILQANEIIHRYNIPVGYDLIFSEFETEDDIEEGLKFMLKLNKPFKIGRHKLAYYPNFEITQRGLKEGKIKKEQIASIDSEIRTQEITKKEAGKKSIMNYHFFLGKRYIPNKFITYMFKNKWHKKYPRLLTNVGGFINKMEHAKFSFENMFRMLLRGEFKYVFNRLINKNEYMPI